MSTIRCDFGSGAVLSVAKQSAHAVIAVRESEDHACTRGFATIAMTPASLRRLATLLTATAEILEAHSG